MLIPLPLSFRAYSNRAYSKNSLFRFTFPSIINTQTLPSRLNSPTPMHPFPNARDPHLSPLLPSTLATSVNVPRNNPSLFAPVQAPHPLPLLPSLPAPSALGDTNIKSPCAMQPKSGMDRDLCTVTATRTDALSMAVESSSASTSSSVQDANSFTNISTSAPAVEVQLTE